MAFYAVGDIQGCYDPLARLLDEVNFDQSKDTLVCVGDLVNRGTKSLQVLRLLKSLDNQCVTVLGNHDIHLLSMYYGIRQPKPSDTVDAILAADDVDKLCKWLRRRPLLYVNEKRKFIVSHAGIYPGWNLQQAQGYANEVEKLLYKNGSCAKLLKRVYGNQPNKWDEGLKNYRRYRFIINAFTRMRFCSPKKRLNFTESGYKGAIRKNRLPWFEFENSSLSDYTVVFGHWSALGLFHRDNILCLDSGYVWGRTMTMAKLPKSRHKSIKFFQVS